MASKAVIPDNHKLTAQTKVNKKYIALIPPAICAVLGRTFSEVSDDSILKSCIPPTCKRGKTEIAMRATFIVFNAYTTKEKPQIAIIVPTTLLARQHYKNFVEIFQDFNCNIKQLSRMVSDSELKKTKIANIVCILCLMKHNEQVINLVNVIPLYFKEVFSKEKRNQFCRLIAIRV